LNGTAGDHGHERIFLTPPPSDANQPIYATQWRRTQRATWWLRNAYQKICGEVVCKWA
jgi:hypothetical protein